MIGSLNKYHTNRNDVSNINQPTHCLLILFTIKTMHLVQRLEYIFLVLLYTSLFTYILSSQLTMLLQKETFSRNHLK